MSLKPPLSAHDHTVGNAKAAIQVVEYGDYQCPYCGDAYPVTQELVRRYGNPAQHRHSIQVEINRKLYMDEQTLDILPAGFDRLRADLRALVESLLATDPRG